MVTSQFSIANPLGLKHLHLGIMAPDGSYAGMDFERDTANVRLVAVDELPPTGLTPASTQFPLAGTQLPPAAAPLAARVDDAIEYGEQCEQEVEPTVIYFTNCQPSVYDGLGAIQWQVAQPHCAACKRDLGADEVYLASVMYDGYIWQNPRCRHCQTILTGEPVDARERAILSARRGTPRSTRDAK